MKKKKEESNVESVNGVTIEKVKSAIDKHEDDDVKNPEKVNTSACPKCAKSVSKREPDKEGIIRCKICTFLWHPTCGGLGREEYVMFLKLAELGHPDMWQCATCKVGMGDLALRWEQTGKIVAESSAKLEKIEAEMERQEL